MPIGEPIYYPDVQSDIDMKNTWKLINYPSSSTAILSIDKTIYVDVTNGTSSGVRGTTAAFQTFAQALAVAQVGDSIVFRPSTISVPHLIPPQTISINGLSVFAYGAYIKVPVTTASPILTVNAIDRFSWYGGELDGQRVGSSISNGGFITLSGGATNTLLQDVYIHGFTNTSVTIAQSVSTKIINCRFEDYFNAINADTGGTTGSAWYDLNILGCKFKNAYSTASNSGAIKLHANCGSYWPGYEISGCSFDSFGELAIENNGASGNGANGGRIHHFNIYGGTGGTGGTYGVSLGDIEGTLVDHGIVRACEFVNYEAAGNARNITFDTVFGYAKDNAGTEVTAINLSISAIASNKPDHVSTLHSKFFYGSTAPIQVQAGTNHLFYDTNIVTDVYQSISLAGSGHSIIGGEIRTEYATGTVLFLDATSSDVFNIIVSGLKVGSSISSHASGTAIQFNIPGSHNIYNVSFIRCVSDGTSYTASWYQTVGGGGGTVSYRVKGCIAPKLNSIYDQVDVYTGFGRDTDTGLLTNGFPLLPNNNSDNQSIFVSGNSTSTPATLSNGHYNVGVKIDKSLGITKADGTLEGVFDTSTGIWDVIGGYKISGTSVESQANKGAASGYAPLDGSSKVPAANLPTLSSGTIASTGAVLKGDGAGNAIASTPTGTGDNVLATSPTLITPTIGVAAATSVNKWVLTAPSTAATITAGADNLTYSMPEITTSIGFRNIPQNSKSTAYTTVLTDSGKNIYHPVGDNNARTFTIDSNANVAYPIGTGMMFTNMAAAALTVAITSDTLTLLGTGTTGSRTIAQYGRLYVEKDTATSWLGIPIANVT